jgi:hypothetical protein
MVLSCCPSCGRECSQTESTCPTCGRRIRLAADPSRPRDGLLRMVNVAFAIVLLLCILVAMILGVLIDQY